jgi:hypothetical protein
MKQKPKDRSFRFEKIEDKWVCYWKNPARFGDTWCTSGFISEEEIKKLLTTKQWADFRSGKRTEFIQTVTREDRKAWIKERFKPKTKRK